MEEQRICSHCGCKTLLDSGAITQEEYEAKKKELLGL